MLVLTRDYCVLHCNLKCHVPLNQTFDTWGFNLSFLASQDTKINRSIPRTFNMGKYVEGWPHPDLRVVPKRDNLLSHMLVPILHMDVLNRQDDWRYWEKLCWCWQNSILRPTDGNVPYASYNWSKPLCFNFATLNMWFSVALKLIRHIYQSGLHDMPCIIKCSMTTFL